jgi:hypothetical protein
MEKLNTVFFTICNEIIYQLSIYQASNEDKNIYIYIYIYNKLLLVDLVQLCKLRYYFHALKAPHASSEFFFFFF